MNNRNLMHKHKTYHALTIQTPKIALPQRQYNMYNCNPLVINTSIFLGQENGVM